MKLIVLGGTGKSGHELVNQALDAGHDVTVVVRNPEKLTIANDRLTVVKGSIFSEELLAEHFKDKDAILSALGSDKFFGKVTIYIDSIKPIIAAMRTAGVKKFICITAWCTKYNREDPGPFLLEWAMKPLLTGNFLKGMSLMEDYLFNECSDINYTIVRAPILSNGPKTDGEIKVDESYYVHGGKASTSMARADVARFMLQCLSNDQWDRKAVAVST